MSGSRELSRRAKKKQGDSLEQGNLDFLPARSGEKNTHGAGISDQTGHFVGGVHDVKFFGHDGVFVLRKTSVAFYYWNCNDGALMLHQETLLPGHALVGMAVSHDSNSLFITCCADACGTVHQYLINKRRFLEDKQHWSAGLFTDPCGIAVSRMGQVVVSDLGSHPGVSLHRNDGRCLIKLGERQGGKHSKNQTTFISPYNVDFDKDDNIVISDCDRHCVYLYDQKGAQLCTMGIPGKAGNEYYMLNTPLGVCIDDQGSILVADVENKRLSAFDCRGNFQGHPLSSQTENFGEPYFMDFLKTGGKRWLALNCFQDKDQSDSIKVFQLQQSRFPNTDKKYALRANKTKS